MAHERFIRTLLNVLLAKDLCPASLDAEELRRAGGLVGGDALRTCFVSLEAQGKEQPPVHLLDGDATDFDANLWLHRLYGEMRRCSQGKCAVLP